MDNQLINMILANILFGQQPDSKGVLSSQQMRSILNANLDKNMVQRLLNPGIFPIVNREDLGPGWYSTHLMASQDNTVFPMITQNPETGKLEMADIRTPSIPYDWQQAARLARERGDTIDFNNPDEAQYFGEHYKEALR